MFVSHRIASAPKLGASLETHAALHTAFRLHVVRNRNVVADDGFHMKAFDRKGALGRPIVTILLHGRARLRAFGKETWLEAGDVTVVESKAAIEMRQEALEGAYDSIALEWDVGSLSTTRPVGLAAARLSVVEFARVAEAAAVVAQPAVCARCAARAMATIVETLRAAGLPFDRCTPDDLIEPVIEQTLRLSRALDDLLSELRSRPMVVDLDAVLGLSERQINRIVTSFNARYGFNAGGWRDTRNRRRLMMGATWMTAPGAQTDAIAAEVGYGSPAAFCRALAEAGLPSPGNIARVVRALG